MTRPDSCVESYYRTQQITAEARRSVGGCRDNATSQRTSRDRRVAGPPADDKEERKQSADETAGWINNHLVTLNCRWVINQGGYEHLISPVTCVTSSARFKETRPASRMIYGQHAHAMRQSFTPSSCLTLCVHDICNRCSCIHCVTSSAVFDRFERICLRILVLKTRRLFWRRYFTYKFSMEYSILSSLKFVHQTCCIKYFILQKLGQRF